MTVRDASSSHRPCLIGITVLVLAERTPVNNIRRGLLHHQVLRRLYYVARIRRCAYCNLQLPSPTQPS